MLPHQERVIEERKELAEKYSKLGQFFHTEMFKGLPEEDKTLLDNQYLVMSSYLEILEQRINRF